MSDLIKGFFWSFDCLFLFKCVVEYILFFWFFNIEIKLRGENEFWTIDIKFVYLYYDNFWKILYFESFNLRFVIKEE